MPKIYSFTSKKAKDNFCKDLKLKKIKYASSKLGKKYLVEVKIGAPRKSKAYSKFTNDINRMFG